MQEELLDALRSRRPKIRERWADLLHAERAVTPLGNPDALVHLIDWTLDEIERALVQPSARKRVGRRPVAVDYRHECPCGRNPLLGYFAAAEQALQEAMILVQAAQPGLDAIGRDASFEELRLVLNTIARREIEAFCGVCQFRTREPGHNECTVGGPLPAFVNS